MSDTLFVKVERVRRLHRARLVEVDVHRGEDGSFGIGLSDENEITNFHHGTNAGRLQMGDQVCKVDHVYLVRERLAHLVQRQFADVQQVRKNSPPPPVCAGLDAALPVQVRLQVSRVLRDDGPTKPCGGEVFAVLEVLRSDGEMLDEMASELWTLRTDLMWGAFWTVPMPPATGSVRFCLHRSRLFTEPLLGRVELPLHKLTPDALCTQWHPLRAKGQPGGQRGEDTILGEARHPSMASARLPAPRHPRRAGFRPHATSRNLTRPHATSRDLVTSHDLTRYPRASDATLCASVPRGLLGQSVGPRRGGRRRRRGLLPLR